MNFFALSGLLLGCFSFALAGYFLFKGKTKIAYLWAVFNISATIWGFGSYMIATTAVASEALFWWRATYVGVIFIPVFFYHFVHALVGLTRKKLLVASYALGVFFLVVNFSGHLISHTRWVFDQFYFDSPPGLLFPYFTVFFALSVSYSHYLLWRCSRKHAQSSVPAKQLRTFYTITGISFFGGAMNFLPVYHIDIYPSFNILTIVYALTISYLLIRSHLSGVGPHIQARFVSIGSLITTFVVGVIVHYSLSHVFYPNNMGIVTLLISLALYHPIRTYFERISTNHFTSSLGM